MLLWVLSSIHTYRHYNDHYTPYISKHGSPWNFHPTDLSLATWRLKLATPMRICRAKTSIIRALLAIDSLWGISAPRSGGKPRNHGRTPWKHRILWASNWHNLETWWENYGLNLKKQVDNHGNTQGSKNWNIRNWDDFFVCPEMVYMKRQFLKIKNQVMGI